MKLCHICDKVSWEREGEPDGWVAISVSGGRVVLTFFRGKPSNTPGPRTPGRAALCRRATPRVARRRRRPVLAAQSKLRFALRSRTGGQPIFAHQPPAHGRFRYACSREDAQRRQQLRVEPGQLRGQELWLDGYNVLTLLESALAGGIILPGRDGCCRDIAGIHRRYRKMNETLPALQLIGETAQAWGVSCCRWWLDKPVSNSGRLKTLILKTANAAGWKNENSELTLARTMSCRTPAR